MRPDSALPFCLIALGASTLGVRPAQAAEPFGDVVFYFGEVHAHTGVSADAGSSDMADTCVGECGTLVDAYADARASGLDFAALTDHINGINVAPSAAYEGTIALAEAANDPSGGFVSLPGAELWLVGPDGELGHKTLLMFGGDATLRSLTMADVQPSGSYSMDVADCAAVHTWASNFVARFGDILLVPHHTAAVRPMPTDWSCFNPDYEPMVEVYSEHGSSMGDGTGYDPLWSGEVAESTVHAALDPAGPALRFGFGAGSDKHNSRPGDVCARDTEMAQHPYGGGLTGVAVPATDTLSRSALYEAMVARRTVATTGPTLPVRVVYVSGGVRLGGLGTDLGVPTGQTLEIEVSVPGAYAGYVTGVELVTPTTRYAMAPSGGGRFEATLTEAEREAWVYAAVAVDGPLWYGSATCDDGGSAGTEYVWLSPSWLSDVPPDLDGDGVAWADGDCADDDAGVYPGAADVPDDGVDQDCDGQDAHVSLDTAEDSAGDTADSAGIVDTGDTAVDSGEPADSAEPEPGPDGCGSCETAGGRAGAALAALALAASARRRALR